MVKKFLRRQGTLISKLGKRRKNKQKWRRPTGRHNKMREKKRGVPAVVGIGHKRDKLQRGRIENKIPARINNLAQLRKINQGEVIIIGKTGKKKRTEILKMAKEKNILISNRYLKENKNESK